MPLKLFAPYNFIAVLTNDDFLPTVASCDEGWVDTKYNKCYKFVTQAQTWYGAQQMCVKLGGNLVMYQSREEIDNMKTLRRGKPGKWLTYIL